MFIGAAHHILWQNILDTQGHASYTDGNEKQVLINFIKAGYPHAAVTGTVLLVTFALSATVWFLRPFPLLLFAGVYVALIMGWKLLYGKISAKLRSMEVTQ